MPMNEIPELCPVVTSQICEFTSDDQRELYRQFCSASNHASRLFTALIRAGAPHSTILKELEHRAGQLPGIAALLGVEQ